MKCDACGGTNLYVVDSRPANNGIGFKRRRECADCGKRITTYEVTQEEYSMIVKSKKFLEKVKEMLDIYKKKDPVDEEDDE